MVGHWVRRLQQQSTQVFSAQMQAHGWDLTSVQFAALDALAQEPGQDQASLAAQIGFDRATLGGVVDRLETKGLITRVVSPNDRRSRVLHLSEAGRVLLERCRPVVVALQPHILPGLDAAEQAQFLALARKALGQGG